MLGVDFLQNFITVSYKVVSYKKMYTYQNSFLL